jgi:hypothetical protein
MGAMSRLVTIVLLSLLAGAALGQVPAGIPYDPVNHPNPIVTWVRNQDFKTATFSQIEQQVGLEIMTLSQDEGRREALELAVPAQSRQRVRMLNDDVEVTFYPVAKQTYRLNSGKSFVLCTFRFPRAVTSAEVLNAAAFNKPRRPADARFGSTPSPDRIDIRGFPGLIFEDDKQRTIYWFELGGGQTVTTDASKDELFRVLEDLL